MLDRRSLLANIRRSYEAGGCFTTSCIATLTGEPERAIRGVVSWLVLGGALAIDGTTTRHDHLGRTYTAKRYRLTGRDLPAGRIRQNREDRETALRLERDRATRGAAADWLSRSWAPSPQRAAR